jgi:macrodomain Ter protein organizer (MatP/YcbG family)
MPRDGYINLTLRQSVRDRLAKIATRQKQTMTEALESMLERTESSLGLKSGRAGKRPGKSKGR